MGWLEDLIGKTSPSWGLKRAEDRAKLEYMKRMFEGAGKGKRTKNWKAGSTSQNTEIQMSLETLRNRSRDLVRNNPFAGNAVEEIALNTVGAGILATITGTGSENRDEELQKRWNDFCGNLSCDFEGLQDFYGLQKMACAQTMEAGQILAKRERKKRKGKNTAFELKMIEADLLDHKKNEQLNNGGFIIQGVEYDSKGKKVAFWILKEHPGDSGILRAASAGHYRIPATEMLDIFEVWRPGQVRGIPRGSSAFLRLRDFDQFEDAQLMRQKIAACFTGVVTNTQPPILGESDDEEDEIPENIEPSTIFQMPYGKEITFSNPPTVVGYKETFEVTMFAVSRAYRVPTPLVTGDLKGVNFSSGRLGFTAFNRQIDSWRWNLLIPRFCNEVFQWFKEDCELQGIDTGGVVASWTPPKRDSYDPAREYAAEINAIRGGLKTLPEVQRSMGYDPKEVMDEWKKTADKMDELELTFDSDPRKITKSGLTQQQAPDNTNEEP